MSRADADFLSDGTRCAAWHYTGDGDALAGPGGRPCVVMAHGFTCTRDTGLDAYARRFAAAGADALAFDYRCVGASDGDPRGLITVARQRADIHAAIAHARALPGVDPERIVLWGFSLGGGHVLDVGADDGRVAAVIVMFGAVDGPAIMRQMLRSERPAVAARVTALAARDAVSALRGGPPVYVPGWGVGGSVAVITAPGAMAAMQSVAGETWRNDCCARVVLTLPALRPGRRAADLRCPMLFQAADVDSVVPTAPIVAAAGLAPGRARVRHYPCDHFDSLGAGEWFGAAADHQTQFLADVLSAAPVPA